MLALIVPALVLSGCKNKKYHLDDDEDEDSTEQVESDDSDSKKEKKLIYGEYKLDNESFEAFFGEDIEQSVKEQGATLDILTSFNFNDDDDLDVEMVYNASIYFQEIRNTMKFNIMIGATGKWHHDQVLKQLTVSIDDLKVNDVDFSFAKEDATTREIMRQLGGEEGLKQQMMKEMNIEDEMEKVKKTQVFTITRLQPDGFTIKPLDSDKRVKFEKVDVEEEVD